MINPLRIVFMGTPEFAAHSLQYLINKNYRVAGVVTVPDKPAGRGQLVHESAVKKTALANGLPVLQPDKLKDPTFIDALQALHADVFVVVAFRMLPEIVWNMPRCGSFNLHASLLPQYRGAAPINWAVINGERETGVTTFFLDAAIDTGAIILNEKVNIEATENAGAVHDKLMFLGAEVIAKTLDLIAAGEVKTKPQATAGELKPAPKIFKDTCAINWTDKAANIHNLVRGLSPYPTAFGELQATGGEVVSVKIFDTTPEIQAHTLPVGTIESNGKTFLKVACNDGFILINELQVAGKKRVNIKDFLLGFRQPENYSFIDKK